MALIKNDIVSMDWEADQFFESKKDGFIAAIRKYSTSAGDVAVIFQNKIAYALLDSDEDKVASIEDCSDAIKLSYKEGVAVEDLYPDNYIELGNTVVYGDGVETAKNLGLSDDDIADINKRLDDLSGYWEVIEETMY